MKKLGIDIGSRCLGIVMLEGSSVTRSHYVEHKGAIAETLLPLLESKEFSNPGLVGLTGCLPGTGSGAMDPVLATVEGARLLFPGCRNLLAIGGESFSLILLDAEGRYREHSVNPPCAAGTGSFLEQQANRLGISVEALAEKALGFGGKPPLISTRCAVFAKTDIIHAMQEGFGLEAICAGVCDGVARNVLDSMLKGRTLHAPIGLVGGVSRNGRIANAIGRILGIQVEVSPHSAVAGAIGAALLGTSRQLDMDAFTSRPAAARQLRPLLSLGMSRFPDFAAHRLEDRDGIEVMRPAKGPRFAEGAWIGIDVGSTSTKAAVIARGGEIAGGVYTHTEGEPVAAVRALLGAMEAVFDGVQGNLLGVCVTGSGRKMVGDLFRADLQVNEITAHARAAVMLYPEADTIIEIGGQDSKFTLLRDGEVSSAAMNYVCAAGTGSFIEEQAKRLGVGLGEFSNLAMEASAPFTSDRCTVYMERDLNTLLAEGWSKEALAAAVLHSVRDNYLSKVVGRSAIGDRIVFQGATARNRALVAAFEQRLGKPIAVSPYCHLAGAIGAALVASDQGIKDSGFDWRLGEARMENEECALCANRCLLTVAVRDGRRTGWGMKCGRDYGERGPRGRTDGQEEETAFQRRYRRALGGLAAAPAVKGPRSSVRIGLPRTLYNLGYEPLWTAFLARLGFTVEPSSGTRAALQKGGGLVNSDFCAPIVAAHGHIRDLMENGVDFIFSPAVTSEEEPGGSGKSRFREKTADAYYCYYSQYLPTIVGNLPMLPLGERLISPLVSFSSQSIPEIARSIHAEMASRIPSVTLQEVQESFERSWEDFKKARRKWAGGFSSSVRTDGNPPLRIALFGRPYVVFDPALSLDIPRKLEDLGCEVWWMEEFDPDGPVPGYSGMFAERMHWHYGRRIIALAELAARTENLYPVFLSCFRCSPDSFLISYVKDVMERFGKPLLVLQLDAHGSDVGYMTRIEAGIASFRNHRLKTQGKKAAGRPAATRARNDSLAAGDTVLLPRLFDEVTSSLWDACFRKAGYGILRVEATPAGLNAGYRFASGGECMPLVSIVGSALETVRTGRIDPKSCYLYLPTLCMACNFPQFPIFADMAFRSAGLGGVKIGLVNTMNPGAVLPQTLSIRMLESNIVGSVISKLACRIRPYEVNAGQTNAVLLEAGKTLTAAVEEGTDLRRALNRAVEGFRDIPRDESRGRKPRIGLLGDLYAKYNELVNQGIQALVERLGGELVLSSPTEYPFHFFDADVRLHGDDPRHLRLLRSIEQRYEKLAEDLIGDLAEPDFSECARLAEECGISHFIVGETSINVGRALYYARHRLVDAIIHVNPMFCCPGVVTASIYRKIQEDFRLPIIDIFYDGTGSPNGILIPHLHYLREKIGENR